MSPVAQGQDLVDGARRGIAGLRLYCCQRVDQPIETGPGSQFVHA